LGWLTTIHEVHKLGLDPAADELWVFGETLKPLRVL
jgi:hypothetical protein